MNKKGREGSVLKNEIFQGWWDWSGVDGLDARRRSGLSCG